MRKGIGLVMIGFFCLWTLFVLYPNPYILFISGYRVINPAINPEAVEAFIKIAPSDPREIERFVLDEIPYQYDWQTYGVPFYFPTVEEVMKNRKGDCKSRFIVLASLFEAKEIPYRQSFSLSHFWIDYEGKEEVSIEAKENAFLLRTEEGTRLQLPRENLRDVYDVLKEGFWDYMPLRKKILLTMGFPITLIIGLLYNNYIIGKLKIEGGDRYRSKI